MANITPSSAASRRVFQRVLAKAAAFVAIALALAGCSAAVRDCMRAHRAGIVQETLLDSTASAFDPTVDSLAGAAYLATGAGVYVDCLRRPPAPPTAR